MPEETKESKDQMEMLGTFSADDSVEDKVDSLWRQLMVYKSFADSDLSDAKIRRAEVEAAREQAEMEAVKTTKLLCEQMNAEAERDLRVAEEKTAQATRDREEADAKLKKTKEMKAKLDEERDQIVADAQKQAQQILEDARSAAERETKDLRRQAFKEIKTVLTRVENMRAAVSEELETQRILTNVSKLKASSKRMLAESGLEDDGGAPAVDSDAAPFVAEPAVNGRPTDSSAPTYAGNGGPAASNNGKVRRAERTTGDKKASGKA